jgi:hypothetical protein
MGRSYIPGHVRRPIKCNHVLPLGDRSALNSKARRLEEKAPPDFVVQNLCLHSGLRVEPE